MKLILNGIEADGIEGDIVFSFVSNNLRDVASRPSNYSNTFELEITNNNRRIFESAEVVTSESVVAYRKLSAQIIVDGLVVVDGFAILQGAKDTYQLNVFSGGTDLIQQIKDFNLELIKDKFDALDHQFIETEIQLRRDNKVSIVYPNIDYGYFEKYEGSLLEVPKEFFFPAVYAKFVLDETFKFLGYTYEGSLFTGEVWQNLALPMYRKTDAGIIDSQHSQKIFYFQLTGNETYLSFNTIGSDEENLYKDFTIPTIGTVKAYDLSTYELGDRLSVDCSGQLESIFGENFLGGYPILEVRLRLVNKTTGAIKGDAFILQYPRERVLSFDFVVNNFNGLNLIDTATDVYVWYFKYSGGTGIFEDYTLQEISALNSISFNIINTKAPENVFVRIYNSLPDFKVSDLLKSILQIEGAFFQVDDSTKKITSFYYQDILNNKSQAYDWSEILDLTEKPEISYRIREYAQDSVFRYENDDKDIFLDEDFGQGSLIVDDQTLDKRKEIVKIPFSLCNVGAIRNEEGTMTKIFTGSKYIKDDLGNDVLDPDATVDNFKARLTLLSDSTEQIYLNNTPKPSRDVVNSITFDKVLPRRYGLISEVLNRTKVVKALFKLDVNDVYNIDFSRPVYVRYFNEYFFINQIEQFNFTRRQSTMVELIRI